MIIKKLYGNETDIMVVNDCIHKKTKCAYCGKSILSGDNEDTYTTRREYFILWNLVGHAVYLHPKCSEELGVHLIKDTRSCER